MNDKRLRFHLIRVGIVALLLASVLSACDLGPGPTPTPTVPVPSPTVPPPATKAPAATTAPTNTPVPQPTATTEPTPTATQPAPTAPVATKVSYKYPAPVLLAPPNGHGFANQFKWEPLDLAADEYYNVSVSYYHNKELRFWGGNTMESPLVTGPAWEKSDDNFYTWWVQVLRDTGEKDEDGNPIGEPVSPKSEVWKFYYEPAQ